MFGSSENGPHPAPWLKATTVWIATSDYFSLFDTVREESNQRQTNGSRWLQANLIKSAAAKRADNNHTKSPQKAVEEGTEHASGAICLQMILIHYYHVTGKAGVWQSIHHSVDMSPSQFP